MLIKASSPLLLFSALILISLGACAKIVHPYKGEPYVARASLPDSSFFSYKRHEGEVFLKELNERETNSYHIFRLLIPVEQPIEGTIYKSKNSDVRRLVILMPLYGEHELPAEMLADFMTVFNQKADFNLIYLKEHSGEDPFDLDLLEQVEREEMLVLTAKDWVEKFRKSVIRVRRVIDWIESGAFFSDPRIGIVGLSTSSFVASVVVSIEPRISAGAIVFGGGNIHKIFAYAEEEHIKGARARVLANSGKTRAELAETLRPLLQSIDPITYAGAISPARILYVDAEFDEFIPHSGREEFWRALGKPARITFLHGHRTAFISLTPLGLHYTPREIIKFFREKL